MPEVIVLSDSDENATPPPASSQFSPQSYTSDFVDLCSSEDDELPAPGDPKFFAGTQAKRKRPELFAVSSSRPLSLSSPTSEVDSSAEEQEESPKKVARTKSTESAKRASKAPRKPRKTDEEKAAEKALKQQAAAQKKEQTKAQKLAEKNAKAEQIVRDKETKKEYMSANKLVNNKRDTLKDMLIIFPQALAGPEAELLKKFEARVAEYDMSVAVENRPPRVPGYNVFTWRRKTYKEYDPEARAWMPVEEYVKTEEVCLLHMGADELARCIRDEDGVKNVVRHVRAVYACTQLFLMVDGLTAYLRRKSGVRYTKDQIERTLAALQMAEHTHLLYVDNVPDAVERLYDLSADLGIKPYKLIERSHLPFCADTKPGVGSGPADTWVKMLAQVHRVTPSAAEGIAAAYPTPGTLFQAYAASANQAARDNLLRNCHVTHNADGTAKVRALGPALSRVVGTVMFGQDPLELAYKGT
ncbi:hypothetical protein C8R43DRAFT_1001425 [Mycena crocata]|nr:hypothetical protein C8R43DRAFT_1001425 [Mycena crocata]